MSLDMVVQGGMVVSPRQVFSASVGIKDGRVVAIGNAEYLSQADRVVNAAGCYVLPGIIDPHYHIMDWIAPGEEIIRSDFDGYQNAGYGWICGRASVAEKWL